MLQFPSTAKVGKIIPKEGFYSHLDLSKKLREKFVSDIQKIVMEYSLTPQCLNLDAAAEIKEIAIVSVHLKRRVFDPELYKALAVKMPLKMLFWFHYDGNAMLAIYHGRLYNGDWCVEEQLRLNMVGFSLDELWRNFVAQIALDEEVGYSGPLTLEERLERREKRRILEKEIKALEHQAQKEIQPKRKYEIFQKIQAYKQELLRNYS